MSALLTANFIRNQSDFSKKKIWSQLCLTKFKQVIATYKFNSPFISIKYFFGCPCISDNAYLFLGSQICWTCVLQFIVMPQVINVHIPFLKLRFLSFFNLNCYILVLLNSVLFNWCCSWTVSKGCEVVIFILTVRKKSNWLERLVTLHIVAMK